MFIYKDLWSYIFLSSRWIPKSANTGLYDKCIFHFIRNWQIVLHAHQQSMRVLVAPYSYQHSTLSVFLLVASLVSVMVPHLSIGFFVSYLLKIDLFLIAYRFLIMSSIRKWAGTWFFTAPSPSTLNGANTWNSPQYMEQHAINIFGMNVNSCLFQFLCFLKIDFCRGYWAKRIYALRVVKDTVKLLYKK